MMKNKMFLFSLVMVSVLILGACAPAATAPAGQQQDTMEEEAMDSEDEMMEDDSSDDEMVEEDPSGDEMMDEEGEDMMEEGEEMMEEDSEMSEHDDIDSKAEDETAEDMGDDDLAGEASMDEEMMETPQWFRIPLTNIHTGETFTIEDQQGKVVLLETMAIWCSNCFRQQGEVAKLHDMLGERDDFVSLGVDIDPNEDAPALVDYTNNNGFDWWYTIAPAELSRDLAANYGDQFLNPPSTPMLIVDRHGEVHVLPFGIKSADSLLDALQPFLVEEM